MIRRAGLAFSLVVVTSLSVAACSSFSDTYPVDKSLDRLPLVAADEKVVSLLPLDEQAHVVTRIRSTDGLDMVLAIHRGKCEVSAVSPGGDDIVFGGQAPTSSSSAFLGTSWHGELKAIGPSDNQGGTVAGVRIELDCATRGVWIGVPLAQRDLTITGTAQLLRAAQAGSNTGIVVRAPGSG